MNVIRKFLGPKSKYDKTIPYTYVAKVNLFEDDEELVNHFFSDTICGLMEYLEHREIVPEQVALYACYLNKEIPIDISRCVDETGNWLKRPEICHSLESYYSQTLKEQYKGHIEYGTCSFDDRDKEGSGPF